MGSLKRVLKEEWARAISARMFQPVSHASSMINSFGR